MFLVLVMVLGATRPMSMHSSILGASLMPPWCSLVPPWCLPGASLHPLTWSQSLFWTPEIVEDSCSNPKCPAPNHPKAKHVGPQAPFFAIFHFQTRTKYPLLFTTWRFGSVFSFFFTFRTFLASISSLFTLVSCSAFGCLVKKCDQSQ